MRTPPLSDPPPDHRFGQMAIGITALEDAYPEHEYWSLHLVPPMLLSPTALSNTVTAYHEAESLEEQCEIADALGCLPHPAIIPFCESVAATPDILPEGDYDDMDRLQIVLAGAFAGSELCERTAAAAIRDPNSFILEGVGVSDLLEELRLHRHTAAGRRLEVAYLAHIEGVAPIREALDESARPGELVLRGDNIHRWFSDLATARVWDRPLAIREVAIWTPAIESNSGNESTTIEPRSEDCSARQYLLPTAADTDWDSYATRTYERALAVCESCPATTPPALWRVQVICSNTANLWGEPLEYALAAWERPS